MIFGEEGDDFEKFILQAYLNQNKVHAHSYVGKKNHAHSVKRKQDVIHTYTHPERKFPGA